MTNQVAHRAIDNVVAHLVAKRKKLTYEKRGVTNEIRLLGERQKTIKKEISHYNKLLYDLGYRDGSEDCDD